ncbi:MAG: BREX system ATP-binding domain-containing protein [Candidatus Natronoplasma sp.]
MDKISSRDKILLYLSHQKGKGEKDKAPYGACQRGISESIDIDHNQVSKALDELVDEGLVECTASPVVGLQRERNVYFRTSKGYQKAEEELRGSLGKKEVTLKDDEEKRKVKLKEISEYVDHEHPLLYGLNQMDQNGTIDLSDSEDEKRDVFVGRESEMKKLRSLLNDVEDGNCRSIFITGEAGVGKTRLVNEFKKYAASEDFEFLVGSAYYDSSQPYHPMREAFKSYIEKETASRSEGFSSVAMLGARASKQRPKVEDKDMFDAEVRRR